MIKDVFVSQAASRQGGGIAPAQPRTWLRGERAKTNLCDCFPYALLTPELQLPANKEEEWVRGRGRGRSETQDGGMRGCGCGLKWRRMLMAWSHMSTSVLQHTQLYLSIYLSISSED